MTKTVAPRSQSQSVLILGASGKLGRMLRAVWSENPPQGSEFHPVFRAVPAGEAGLTWHPTASPDGLPACRAILALWGVTGGTVAELAMNARLAESALALGQALGAHRVLHCSSAAVYQPGPVALRETDAPAPGRPYALAKLHMEQAVRAWHSAHPDGPESVLMRIGNVAGADSLFANMANGGRIRLDQFADGQGPERSYVAPHDVARVCQALIHAPQVPEVVNVAAPRPTPMQALAAAAGCGNDWVRAPDGANRIVALDTTRLSALCPLPNSSAGADYLVDSARRTGVWP